MSDSKTTILEGPDGRLYEIPREALETYLVPGERFEEIRQRQASESGTPHADSEEGGIPAGHTLPPGHAHPPAGPPAMSIEPQTGGVVLNFYFDGGPPRITTAEQSQPDSGVEGYHFSNDESGIASLHEEWLDGTYVDKKDGSAKIGVHSHHAVYGNAL